MFEELISIVSLINDDDTKKKIEGKKYEAEDATKITDKQISKIFFDITGQSEMNIKSHDMFTYDYKTKNIYQSGENIKNICFGCPIIFEEMKDQVLISIVPDEILINYLHVNKNCNYVACHIITEYYIENTTHMSLLLFDNVRKKCYYIDSNGKTKQNRKFYDSFFENKIISLCDCGITYTYEESEKWNSYGISLNIIYNNSELNEKGNCVMWTIFILHIITLTLLHPGDLYLKLEFSTKEERAYALKEYARTMTLKYGEITN